MTLYFKVAILILMVAVAGFGVYKYNDAIADAATAEHQKNEMKSALEKQSHENELLQGRYDKLDAVMQEKQSYEQAIAAQLADFDRKLDGLSRTSPQVRAWADAPIPPSVRGLLRSNTAGSGGDEVREPAKSTDSKNPRTRTSNR